MKLGHLVQGRFESRPNRFVAQVDIEGQSTMGHVANPGRCAELLLPGCTVWLEPASNRRRKTQYTLSLVEHDGVLVSMRSHRANDLLAEALQKGVIPGWEQDGFRREVSHGSSRFDFVLGTGHESRWIEAKSVTLVEQRVALFPDAPTARGARHVRELTDLARQGNLAGVAFVVQRPDADVCMPHAANDPVFSESLSDAIACGVQARAFRCRVSLSEICLVDEIPVRISS